MKKTTLKIVANILLFILCCISCKKHSGIDTGSPGFPSASIYISVAGRIVNNQNQPVSGAIVKAGALSSLSDVNGEFKLVGTSVNENAAFITIEKTGYFTGSRTFAATQNHKHYIEIMLLPKQNIGSINSSNGGTITLGNGSSITLPSNGIINQASGSAYNGNVNVAMTWIDPTSTDLFRQMPGDLRGIDESNNQVGLQSFGMLGVELTGSGGEKLQIAAGKKATLKFPLPSSIQSSAPASIALWSFNDSTGLWKQEGTATKNGTYYLAQVSHFSFWNCDDPFTLAKFSTTIVSQTNQPLPYAFIRIKRPNGSYGYGFSDSIGYVTGFVPINETLTLEVSPSSFCPLIYTQIIGPFASNSTNPLGTINIAVPSVSSSTFTGTVVNCNNIPVSNGYVDIKIDNRNYRASLSATGAFSLSALTCSVSSIYCYAVDNATNQQSSTITITNTGNNNVGTIMACGTATNRFLNYSQQGQSYFITAPPDSVYVIPSFNLLGSSCQVIGGFTANYSAKILFGFPLTAGLGTYPVSAMGSSIMGPFTILSNASVTFTEYGTQAGSYLAGSFFAPFSTYDSTTNTTYTNPLNCTFRVRR